MLKLASHEIESYLREKGLTFRRRGQKAECKICPFCSGGEHGDKYSFVVYLDQTGGNFKCMRGSCAASGSFWQLAEHFGDDPKEFYSRENFNRPRSETESNIVSELKPVLTFKSEAITPQKLTGNALAYLEKRGFDAETLDALPIWCDEIGNINFGYYFESELCFVKVRKPAKPEKGEPKAWAKWKGGLRTLWMLELCDLSKQHLVITFGEYDAVALRHAGIENVVSVPSGDTDLEWINVCYDQLKPLTEIILWIDNDEAGKTALPKIANRLGIRKIKVVETEYKDANEMLVYETKKTSGDAARDALFAAVYQAKWLHKGDVMQFSDIPDSETSFDGYRSGIEILDSNLGGLLNGRLTVIFGDTKSGKSTLVNQIVMTAIEQNGKACVYSGEDELSDYKYKTQVHVAGYDGGDTQTSKAGAEYIVVSDEYKRKVNDWAFNRLFVLSRKSYLNEDNLIENFQLAFERLGCNLFVVDNLMKLVVSKDTTNLNFRQTQVVNKLSDFAKETGAHIILVAHSNKDGSETEPPKSIREVSGAKEIVNLCDSLISVWRIPDDLKQNYDRADTVLTILANRVFGIKISGNMFFDWRIKRLAATLSEMQNTRYNLDIPN